MSNKKLGNGDWGLALQLASAGQMDGDAVALSTRPIGRNQAKAT
jgi:hypothetical protein